MIKFEPTNDPLCQFPGVYIMFMEDTSIVYVCREDKTALSAGVETDYLMKLLVLMEAGMRIQFEPLTQEEVQELHERLKECAPLFMEWRKEEKGSTDE